MAYLRVKAFQAWSSKVLNFETILMVDNGLWDGSVALVMGTSSGTHCGAADTSGFQELANEGIMHHIIL